MRSAIALFLCVVGCEGGAATISAFKERERNPPPPDLIHEFVGAVTLQHWQDVSCRTGVTPDDAPNTDPLFAPPNPADGLEASLRDGDATLDPALAQACIAKVATAPSCWGPDSGWNPVAECTTAVTGHKAEQAACRTSLECASGYCDVGSAEQVCQPRAPPPQACRSDSDCSGTDQCMNGVCWYSGTLPLGASCYLTGTNPCAAGLYCHVAGFPMPSSGGTCEPRIAEGGACDMSAYAGPLILPVCEGHRVCAGVSPNVRPGRCAVPGDVGAACEVDNNFDVHFGDFTYGDCLLDLMCDEGTHTCRQLPGVGMSCHRGRCFMGLTCGANGVCE